MPKVTFVNEHRTVEVAAGRKISDVAAELGIAVCREEFVGSGIGNYTVWVKGPDGCLSPPGFWEKRAISGTRRLANKAKVLGDVEVWTQAGLRDRLRAPRPSTRPHPPRPIRRPAASASAPPAPPPSRAATPRPSARASARPSPATPGRRGPAGAKAAAAAAEEEEESDE